ncbi:hypothetical protein PG987_016595 [Apiospora arundinis]
MSTPMHFRPLEQSRHRQDRHRHTQTPSTSEPGAPWLSLRLHPSSPLHIARRPSGYGLNANNRTFNDSGR